MLYFGGRETGGKKGRCEYHPTRERRDAGVIFTRARVSLALLSLKGKWGLLVVYNVHIKSSKILFTRFKFTMYAKWQVYTTLFQLWRFMGIQFITGAQPKAGTGLKMQTVRFFNVTLLGVYRCLRYIAGSLKSYPPF